MLDAAGIGGTPDQEATSDDDMDFRLNAEFEFEYLVDILVAGPSELPRRRIVQKTRIAFTTDKHYH